MHYGKISQAARPDSIIRPDPLVHPLPSQRFVHCMNARNQLGRAKRCVRPGRTRPYMRPETSWKDLRYPTNWSCRSAATVPDRRILFLAVGRKRKLLYRPAEYFERGSRSFECPPTPLPDIRTAGNSTPGCPHSAGCLGPWRSVPLESEPYFGATGAAQSTDGVERHQIHTGLHFERDRSVQPLDFDCKFSNPLCAEAEDVIGEPEMLSAEIAFQLPHFFCNASC